MTTPTNPLNILPCLDSAAMAQARRRELDISRNLAAELGATAVEYARRGFYINPDGIVVDLSRQVVAACAKKISIPPDMPLAILDVSRTEQTNIQIVNETTLQAGRRLVERGFRPLALNFANGIHPGGGFLSGALAQEEVLCRSSALYLTLEGDPMYAYHRQRGTPDSTDWAIYSPDVPVFRSDEGSELDQAWLLSFITCAAPYAPAIGQPLAGDLLQKRILRVLAITQAYGHHALVLGAWGCGAFENDPFRTARDFRGALEGEFKGVFSEIVLAITDWSSDRKFLKPFCDVFNLKSTTGKE